MSQLAARVEERIREWNVTVENTLETDSSIVLFGKRVDQPVVLKVVRRPGDEWHCGEVLKAFDGRGMVRAYKHVDGAVLLERVEPGTSLVALSLEGRDDEAIDVLCEVIERISHQHESLEGFTGVQEWQRAFEWYLANSDTQIPRDLVERGGEIYRELCATQQNLTLLHGDLHHDNVLLDSRRGWLAIDPKGVVGEIEYEIGTSLHNPREMPELFSSVEIVERRLQRFVRRLNLDYDRAVRWGFAQAVLSAIWLVEDGFVVDERDTSMMLARAMRPLVE